MDQHPVPQNISSYEFRLVGEMTLKQFFQVAGGILIGIVLFRMPLPFFLKWPLILVAVLTGVMLAFVPVNGRPFSQWIMAFIRSIYSATEFSWASTSAQPLDTLPQFVNPSKSSALDQLESQVFSRITTLLSGGVPAAAPAAQPLPTEPVAPLPPSPSPITPLPTPAPMMAPAAFTPPPAAPTSAPTRLVVSTETENHVIASHESAAPAIATPEVTDLPPTPAKPAPTNPTPVYSASTLPMPPPAAPQSLAPQAQTASNLPIPERPNIVSGVVMSGGQPVDGAIVEILNSATGIPVRALRSNKNGQFQTATPLSKGNYNISVEKAGLTFAPVSIICDDKIISPIQLSA